MGCGVVRQDPPECYYRLPFAVIYGDIEMSPIVSAGSFYKAIVSMWTREYLKVGGVSWL